MLEKDAQLMKTIGRAIAKYRQASNLTQAELAEILGMSNDAVSRMERGKIVPSILRLFELSEIFHCEAADLLTETSNRSTDQARKLEILFDNLTSAERSELVDLLEKMVRWKNM
ncbi:helix-turn-helix domain-containing protein [Lonepinella sp. MS14436]|uniref:helix-turn-helix domain-containing protein n=1 Tax=Lonepinella sp. MS14436 TaxID=3003619 RepID=UPI0036DE1041